MQYVKRKLNTSCRPGFEEWPGGVAEERRAFFWLPAGCQWKFSVSEHEEKPGNQGKDVYISLLTTVVCDK